MISEDYNLEIVESDSMSIIIYKHKSVPCRKCGQNSNKLYGYSEVMFDEKCAKEVFGPEKVNKAKIVVKPLVNRDKIIKEKRKW